MRYHELAADDQKEYDRRLELITYIIQYYTNQFFSLRMHFQPNDQIFHVSREEFNRRMKLLHPLFTIGIEDGETVGMWEHNSILEWFMEMLAGTTYKITLADAIQKIKEQFDLGKDSETRFMYDHVRMDKAIKEFVTKIHECKTPYTLWHFDINGGFGITCAATPRRS